MTTHRIPVSDGELYVETAGSGPAVVLLHGGLLDAAMWDEQIDALAATYTVVRYDARSHGRSSTATADHRPDDDLVEVLDALDVDRAALIGCSMGGGTAADFALVHPDRVWALVLVGPGLQPMRFDDPFVQAAHADQAAAIDAQDAEGYVEPFLRYAVDGPLRQPSDTDPALRRRLHDSALATVGAHHAAQGQVRSREAARHLERITAPTLLVLGDLDLPDLRRVVDDAAARLPRADRLTIDGGGHMVNIERAEAFNAAVLRHLAGHRPG